ncbi:MAG: putative drug resistant transporter [Mycobacterium sp.]|jgi:EmrB/QacA subfamily drug resistance transporter|nr:putative drug resistant transporter [Mycobacterium sp.]
MSVDHALPAVTRRLDDSKPPARRGAILVVLLLAQLMIVLDATIVNIALPSAQKSLDFSTANRQWIVTAYSLSFGSLLLLGGKLSDLFGRRTTLLIGLIGFAVASAVGGAATGFGMLVVARAAQGAFGALLAPSVLALLSTTYTEAKDRAKAFGIFGAVSGTGGAVGLLLGGVLTEYLSWRWCLYVNLIMAALAVTGTLLLIPRRELNLARPKLDVPGSLAVTLGLVGIVYGLGHAESGGWSSAATVWPIVFGVLALITFVLIESRVAHPLLPLRVVLDRTRGGSYFAIAIVGAGLFAVFLFLSYFMSQSLGFSPIETGLGFLPMIFSLTATTVILGTRVLNRYGPRLAMSVGTAIAAVGMLLLAQLKVSSGYADGVLPGLVVVGFGLGIMFSSAINASTAGVQAEDAGVASAMVNIGQQVGGSIGTALLSTLAATAATNYLTSHGSSAAAAAQASLRSYTTAFYAAAIIFAVGAIVSAFLIKRGLLPEEAGAEPVGVMG